ncbi:MAG TPA: S8 family serine peptidase [Symbiobacteriaceae bacterium]|nr:S8 family serine peptidase [Symbiobacteriaceae bacterium]
MTRKRTAWVAALMVLAGLVAGAPARAGAPVRARVAADLGARLAAAAADDSFDVLVTTLDDPAAVQRQLGVTGVTYQRALQGFSARLTAAQIKQLQAAAGVETITADTPVHVTGELNERWAGTAAARSDFGITGDGDGLLAEYSTDDVVIAIVDTGIDAGHRDLAGKVLAWKDLVNDEPEPYDDHGHGTHVAGIAAGAGAANPALRGVAPGAALVGVKVLDKDGGAQISRVIEGIEWVLEHQAEYHIKVVKSDEGQVLRSGEYCS